MTRLFGRRRTDPKRYADARARKNYAGTSPITKSSGKSSVVLARYARNQRLSDTVTNPLPWEKGIRTMLGVPLLSGEELLGVLHVGSFTERRFTEADSDRPAHVASRVAAAVQARELEVERAAARVVQRSLIPTRLPQLPGIEFAARYVPAEIGWVGGDWYDAFALPNGRLWVIVGDVVGHGMRSALVMGRLRSSLRSHALDDHSPEEVVATRASASSGLAGRSLSTTFPCTPATKTPSWSIPTAPS